MHLDGTNPQSNLNTIEIDSESDGDDEMEVDDQNGCDSVFVRRHRLASFNLALDIPGIKSRSLLYVI
jgi:hypothetical protein